MKTRFQFRAWHWVLLAFLLIGSVAIATPQSWLPQTRGLMEYWRTRVRPASSDDGTAHDEEEQDNGHAGHSEDASIELSAGALENIGYRPMTISLQPFTRTITLPAIVVERPGRSQIQITAPLTGIITKIIPIEGVAVEADSPLFKIRLTHEELVTAQRDFLRSAESLDVVKREIKRLRKLVDENVVPRKRVLEYEYEKQKLEASLNAERQALLLHGLNKEQVDAILRDRELFQTMTILAPKDSSDSAGCDNGHSFHVQQLPVTLGQQVEAGDTLCVLANHCVLFIEGRAFADDAVRLREAARQAWKVSASLLVGRQETVAIDDLRLLYLSDRIDPESRAFRFYVTLPNEVVLDQRSPDGNRFIEWKFKPGQRMELHVPVEKWKDQIVLPVEAVVEEGPETYLYEQNGDHFDRVPVHVEYRDQDQVVVANDGSVFPGDVVAAHGAYQMHLALKNKGGGGIDPHAGHNH